MELNRSSDIRTATIRPYGQADAAATLAIFLAAVIETAAADYSPEQILAWARPDAREVSTWHAAMQKRNSFVATVQGSPVGFSDVNELGYIDMLFVAPRHQRQGVAGQLMSHVESHARRAHTAELTADVSITARPFFEHCGFIVEAEQHPVLGGVQMINFSMKKALLGTEVPPLSLEINTMTRPQLRDALGQAGVLLNDLAIMLLDDSIFDLPQPETLIVGERSLIELGLEHGAVLSRIFHAARDVGLDLCPLVAAPYLRLVLREQGAAPDRVMSAGHAPSGSLTVASPPLHLDDAFPKGFYLRVVDGQQWLRGYRCDDDYEWNPHDRFVFSSRLSSPVLKQVMAW